MAPVKSKKLGSQSTLDFRRTKSSTGPLIKGKTDKVPAIKKSSSLKKETARETTSSIDSSSFDSDTDESEIPPGIVISKKRVEVKAPQVEKIEREELNLKKYNKLLGESKAKVNGLPFIHGEDLNKIHHILRTFDLSYRYGPCVGMTRMERWSRAKEMGLEPPMEIKEILETKQGVEQDEYKQSVFFDEV